MERIDCTSTFVDAPGLRPTAAEADMPISPTPMAAPMAAKPTWMFPPSRFPIVSAPVPVSNAIVDISAFPSLLFLLPGGRPANSQFRLSHCCGWFLMLTNQQREYGGQQHENQGLHQTHEQF